MDVFNLLYGVTVYIKTHAFVAQKKSLCTCGPSTERDLHIKTIIVAGCGDLCMQVYCSWMW